jgi:hypothetical protein
MEIDFEDYDRIGPILDTIALWSLPSLRSLDLTADPTEPDVFKAFFRSHGPKITTLKFQVWNEPEIPITSITQLCPSVVDLGFHIYSLNELLPSLSELRRITLFGETDCYEAPAFDEALKFIFSNVQPKLECIRLQEIFLQNMDMSGWFAECLDEWKRAAEKWIGERKVRLESGDGVLLEFSQVPGED